MPSVAHILSANAAAIPSTYSPVAVFVGGTAGIGKAMAEAFARHTRGNAHIILVGRNKSAADAILARLPKTSTAEHHFVACDVSSMSAVRAASRDILSHTSSKINYLVMSTGILTLDSRQETEEGIDRKLAVHYYGRWAFVDALLPALKNAKNAGEDAKVLSVLAAGKGGEIDLTDLGLKRSFSVVRAATQSPTYTDLMMEAFAAKEPDLSFIHSYPGVVRTGIFSSSSSLLIRSSSFLFNMLPFFTTAPEHCAEYMWHGVFNAAKGAHRVGSRGEDLGMDNYYGSADARDKLWQHTAAATKAVES